MATHELQLKTQKVHTHHDAPVARKRQPVGHLGPRQNRGKVSFVDTKQIKAPPADAPDGLPKPRVAFQLPRHLPAAEGIVAAFDGVIEHAIVLAQMADIDPKEAVHEFRKDVRRARAVVALMRDTGRVQNTNALGHRLKAVLDPTSDLRDADVLSDTLAATKIAGVSTKDIGAGSDEAGVTTLQATIDELTAISARFAELIPADLSLGDIEKAVKQSYERTRELRRHAKKTHVGDDVHDWRKRTKELRYQVDLLLPPGDDAAGQMRKELAALATDLGDATDLMVLRHNVIEHSTKKKKLSKWTKKIDAKIEQKVDEVMASSQAFFHEKPKALAHEILTLRD